MVDVKTIGTWGANPAIRLNGMELRKTGMSEKDQVTVEYKKDQIIIKKVKQEVK